MLWTQTASTSCWDGSADDDDDDVENEDAAGESSLMIGMETDAAPSSVVALSAGTGDDADDAAAKEATAFTWF